ncbi:hypothetical protein [uncultured Thiodictyon sp.]|uniref:hypothetical protein n=1 Tax=uncultured Thiodictyon sp. TaxID=1846217 RepID=UPI00260012A3|nr:hypothetical protein [uncultured Thiodictyon sp.]
MSAFSKWLVLACGLFGLTAGAYHAYLLASPKKVLVVVDSSYPMGRVWDRVPPVLQSLSGRRYSVFALATDKGLIHGWQPTLDLGPASPYAPRQLTDLWQRLPVDERREAQEVDLITNATPGELPSGGGWTVLRLAP